LVRAVPNQLVVPCQDCQALALPWQVDPCAKNALILVAMIPGRAQLHIRVALVVELWVHEPGLCDHVELVHRAIPVAFPV